MTAASSREALVLQLHRIQTRDEFTLLHPIAFVHVGSISRPAILKDISTCVSSRLPETRMRLSGLLKVPDLQRYTRRGGHENNDGQSLFHWFT